MRKRPVRTLKLILCADCGQPCMRLPPGVFCPKCVRKRLLASEKQRRVRKVTEDPDWYRRQNSQKNAWKHKRILAKGPIKCHVCGAEQPRIRGRREGALCPTDRRLAERWRNQFARRQRMRGQILTPHKCVNCGTSVPRIKGRRPETARCAPCRRLRINELRRIRENRERSGGESHAA